MRSPGSKADLFTNVITFVNMISILINIIMKTPFSDEGLKLLNL